MSEGERCWNEGFSPAYTLKYNGTAEAGNVSARIVARVFPSTPGQKAVDGLDPSYICISPMSKATGQVVGTDPKLEAFFKDENDEPILRKHLPLTTTLGEVRKANPFGPSDLWIDFHLPGAGRLERIELLSTPKQPGAQLCYHMNIDDVNPLTDDNDSGDQVVSTVQVVIWKWSERIKTALGTDSFAVNWGGPNWKHVQAEGSVMYYLDGEMAYLIFEREHTSWENLDAVTLNELSGRASVLCDILEKMSEEIRSYHPDMEFHGRKPRE
jgi:hypothetical protein